MKKKAIIFDSGTIISFGMNGMFEELQKLKSVFNGHFIITEEVKGEVIDRPLKTKRFEYEALRVKELLDEKVFEMPSDLGLSRDEILRETKSLLDIANNTFFAEGKEVKILDEGEVSCLAVSKILTEKNVKNVIAADERTIKIISERPEYLKKRLNGKLHKRIDSRKENYKFFKGFRFIRSCELVFVLYKKGLTKTKGIEMLDAMLYAMKFKGCGMSDEDIKEIKGMVNKV